MQITMTGQRINNNKITKQVTSVVYNEWSTKNISHVGRHNKMQVFGPTCVTVSIAYFRKNVWSSFNIFNYCDKSKVDYFKIIIFICTSFPLTIVSKTRKFLT